MARKNKIFEGLIDALGWGVFIGNVTVIVAWFWMAVQVSLSFLFFFVCLSLCLPACSGCLSDYARHTSVLRSVAILTRFSSVANADY